MMHGNMNLKDWSNRVEACQHLIDRLPDDAVVFFIDEAHFHISGCVNKQNIRFKNYVI
jgi:hypothetical protein